MKKIYFEKYFQRKKSKIKIFGGKKHENKNFGKNQNFWRKTSKILKNQNFWKIENLKNRKIENVEILKIQFLHDRAKGAFSVGKKVWT